MYNHTSTHNHYPTSLVPVLCLHCPLCRHHGLAGLSGRFVPRLCQVMQWHQLQLLHHHCHRLKPWLLKPPSVLLLQRLHTGTTPKRVVS